MPAPKPEPGPVERRRAPIEELRAKRRATADRAIERLARERAWYERWDASFREQEDRELAELEATMSGRIAAPGAANGTE